MSVSLPPVHPLINLAKAVNVVWLLALIGLEVGAVNSRADGWNYWSQVFIANQQFGNNGTKLATDGTNLYYSTALDGVYRATLADRNFSVLPLTGFPLWDANTNTNGYAVTHIAATPQGTVVISGSPINVSSNLITFNPPGSANNTLPVFYWWDETNQLWHAATVTGKSYPYTSNVGNFSIAPDGSLWTCSGFYPYAYRSTNGGHSYTALDINARVPTNYFPMPLSGQGTFGALFSVCAGWNNEVVIGSETGGFLHTTNNGATWRSLDQNFTNTNSVNPLGRTGDARVAGIDHYGNFLCENFLPANSPAQNIWSGVKLIGWNPRDSSVFSATNGLPVGYGVSYAMTRSSGVTYTFMNQGSNNLGGVYRALDGKNWSQFNDNLPAVSANVGTALSPGNCLTAFDNTFLIGIGNIIYSFDSTPPPINNRAPLALPQNLNFWENSPTNLTLTGSDADGDDLNFIIVTEPLHGTLTGTPPDLTYTPSNNVTGLDQFTFVVGDGSVSSAPAVVNLYINSPTNTLSAITITNPLNGTVFIGPTNLTLAAAVSDPDGINKVNFYSDANSIVTVSNAPYALTLTNLPPGEHVFFARAFDNLGARTWSAPIRVTVLPTAPGLRIQQVDSENVAVTWPLDLDGFFIESAPEASGPWTLSPYPPLYFSNGQTTTIPLAEQQFFRLMRPH